MPEIFEYFDYRKFLKELFEEKKKEKRQFSHRAVLQKMGISSTGFLANVISGRKNLTQQQVQRLVQILKLKAGEARYFECLVLFNQAKSLDEKNVGMKRLVANQKVETKALAKKQFNLFTKWYYVVLREMLYFHRLKDDYRTAARLLMPSVSAEEVEKAVNELHDLELLEKDEEGYFKQKDASLSTGEEVRSLQVANFQLETMDLAKSAMERVPMPEREISTITLTLSAASFAQIKGEIQAFHRRMASIAAADEQVDQVYQCNVQFFPVTRKKDSE